MGLAHLPQAVEAAARNQAKVSGIDRQALVHQAAHQSVKKPRTKSLVPTLPFPHQSGGVCYVVTFAIAANHLVDNVKRMLQVGVQHDHRVARCEVESGGTGNLVSEVARQMDDFHPRVFCGPLRNLRQRCVVTAIVDENNLGFT